MHATLHQRGEPYDAALPFLCQLSRSTFNFVALTDRQRKINRLIVTDQVHNGNKMRRFFTFQMFPDNGINIVSVVLHSHLAGRRLSLKHIRQGKELPRIVQDNEFDFNYQQSHTLENEVKVLPGDELVAECVYGTLDRAYPTLGGYAATQEMCLAFVLHYPRTRLAACYSMTPVKELFKTLGVDSFKGVTVDHLEQLFLTTG